MNKIDWTKPLELSDGTPLVLCTSEKSNPDSCGDYYLNREDGLPFTREQQTGTSRVFIAKPCGREWRPGDRSPGLKVRNRASLVTVYHRDFSTRQWPAVGTANGVVTLRDLSGRNRHFFEDSGESISGDGYQLKQPELPKVVYWHTVGTDGLGGLRYPTKQQAERLLSCGGKSNLGVLRFTMVDGKLTDVALED